MYFKNEKCFKKYLVCIATLFALGLLCSCEKSPVDFIMEENGVYVPPAANQFAIDKETEVETIEPTEAHRTYPEDFWLSPDNEVNIGERQFLTKINYIFNHIDSFTNSSIVVEGMYGWYVSWDGTFEFPMIYRNGPAEYGDDQYGGFYLVNINQDFYNLNDWIKVRGKPFVYEHTDSEGEVQKYLFLVVETIDVLPLKDRKQEMVND